MVEVTEGVIMVQKWNFQETEIMGLIKVTPFNTEDIRGCFIKDYSKEVFEANGIKHDLKEVFYSTSRKGTVRGLHFQRVKQQSKLVRCVWGHIWDVVVDLRTGSPTFKRWMAFDLTGEQHNEILVPDGCAHGFLALMDSLVSYKCNEKFYSEYDDGIIWNDPDIGVTWPLEQVGGREKVILSDKDKNLQSFAQFMGTCGEF